MTYILIGFTVLISLSAFNNSEFFSKIQFNAYQIFHRKELFRLLSHGFVHASWFHLIVNMFVLYSFGENAELWLQQLQVQGIIGNYRLIYLLFYLSAIVVASLTSLFKHRNNIWYNSVGASGAVSALVFFSIFFQPWATFRIFIPIPIPIKAIFLGILYLAYSHYMSRKSNDNINHDAHFIGAVYGFLFPLILNYRLIEHFITQLFGK